MTAITTIVAEAKKIQKKYPKKDWKDCIKQASAIYRSKHKKKKISGVKKKASKKKGSYHKDTKSHNVRISVVSGTPKEKAAKKSVKKVLKKAGYRLPHGYTLKKGKVKNVIGRVFSQDEIDFLHKESKESKNYHYRGKMLFGQFVVLKETKNGTPIKKWIVDDLEVANLLSAELNKGKKYKSVKSSKI